MTASKPAIGSTTSGRNLGPIDEGTDPIGIGPILRRQGRVVSGDGHDRDRVDLRPIRMDIVEAANAGNEHVLAAGQADFAREALFLPSAHAAVGLPLARLPLQLVAEKA